MQVKVCKRGWCFIYLQISDIHLYNCMFCIYVFVYYLKFDNEKKNFILLFKYLGQYNVQVKKMII